MKFSDIKKEDWMQLQPYLDTCLLPLTGLTGIEEPWEVTERLEQLRDMMDLVEIPYKGRVVTYPALHYTDGEHDLLHINEVCRKIKQSGFKYVIVITAAESVARSNIEGVDLLLTADGNRLSKAEVSSRIESLWRKQPETME